MKQNQNDDTALYRALKAQFEMTPAQLARLEQNLRAAAPSQAAQQPTRRHTPRSERQKPAIGQYWYAARLLPLAACLMVAFTSGYLMLRVFQRPELPNTVQLSSAALEEQTLPPVTETQPQTGSDLAAEQTTCSTEPTQTHTISQGIAPQTTASQTAAPQPPATTASAAATSARTTRSTAAEESPVSPAVSEPETPSSTTTNTNCEETAAVTTKHTASASGGETTAPQETTVQQETPTAPTTQEADIVLPDVYVRAGEEAVIRVLVARDIAACAGLQFIAHLSEGGIPLTEAAVSTDLEAILAQYGETPTVNVTEDSLYVLYAHAENIALPAGTELLTLRLTIPADTPSGEYAFAVRYAQEIKLVRIVSPNGPTETLEISYSLGRIIVGS